MVVAVGGGGGGGCASSVCECALVVLASRVGVGVGVGVGGGGTVRAHSRTHPPTRLPTDLPTHLTARPPPTSSCDTLSASFRSKALRRPCSAIMKLSPSSAAMVDIVAGVGSRG